MVMKLSKLDVVIVNNYWHKEERGVIVETSDKIIDGVGPFVSVKFINGQVEHGIPENVCTPELNAPIHQLRLNLI
jgi:hypothetical protein